MTENERKAIDALQDMIAEGQSNGDVIVARDDEEELNTAIQAIEEIQQYRAIGTVEELKSLKENGAFSGIELAQIVSMQMKLKEYQSIGTIEEFKALKEKDNILAVNVAELEIKFEQTVAEILDKTGSDFTIADFNIKRYSDRICEIVRKGGIK